MYIFKISFISENETRDQVKAKGILISFAGTDPEISICGVNIIYHNIYIKIYKFKTDKVTS